MLHFCPSVLAVLAGSLSDKQHWSRRRLSRPSHLGSALSEHSERGHFTAEPTGQMSPAASTGRFVGSPDICQDLVWQVTRVCRQNSQTALLQSQAQWAVQTGLLEALLDNIAADFALLIHKPITLFCTLYWSSKRYPHCTLLLINTGSSSLLRIDGVTEQKT